MTGEPLTREEWVARFVDGAGNLIPADNNGAVPGRRVHFSEFDAYARAFPVVIDVLGDMLSEFFTVNGGDFDQRIQLPDDAQESVASLVTCELSGQLPDGWVIEVGENAPAFGRGGGAYYLVVLGENRAKMCLGELIDVGVVRVLS